MTKIDDNNETIGEINNAINQKPGTWTEEEFYDKEIIPLIRELVEKCQSRKIPFFMHIVYADDEKKVTAGSFLNTCGRKGEHIKKMATYANIITGNRDVCLLYTSPSPRDLSTSRMPSSA
eukprot:TRINITY_DN28394_c0_g1_i1.p1 TRINITY_DN28394_c0_g1~~TRINITY_DN28394_c0_g1_i1.p1  ORF type:complete len:120 (-),score=27.93 TRINITY_DN28394_c0_g1_i1:57-416(-)